MSLFQPRKRLFGVSLDPADDPWSIELKQAWMIGSGNGSGGNGYWLDPYDAITDHLRGTLEDLKIELAGKVQVPSWLWTRPNPSDLDLVTTQNIGEFYDGEGILHTAGQVQSFVESKVFPAMPIMVGVDHSTTMGVVSALAAKYGPEKISVIVLDQHFDAIRLSDRVEVTSGAFSNPDSEMSLALRNVAISHKDSCSCGNFWSYLIDRGRICPENLSFVGVGDYPGHKVDLTSDSPFTRTYLEFEEKGCRFFPLEEFEGEYQDSLRRFIAEAICTPNVYVSLDLDVGSFNATWAARYMDRPGITREHLISAATHIRDTCQHRGVDLVGLDITEFSMHFLGLDTDEGVEDSTLPLVRDFLTALSACPLP